MPSKNGKRRRALNLWKGQRKRLTSSSLCKTGRQQSTWSWNGSKYFVSFVYFFIYHQRESTQLSHADAYYIFFPTNCTNQTGLFFEANLEHYSRSLENRQNKTIQQNQRTDLGMVCWSLNDVQFSAFISYALNVNKDGATLPDSWGKYCDRILHSKNKRRVIFMSNLFKKPYFLYSRPYIFSYR